MTAMSMTMSMSGARLLREKAVTKSIHSVLKTNTSRENEDESRLKQEEEEDEMQGNILQAIN